jgi:hypothetical protein
VLLPFQHLHVDSLIEHTLSYDNLLFCMDNETGAEQAWSDYWAHYIRDAYKTAGKTVLLTEMCDDHDITSERHHRTVKNPDLYEYLDFSQNNHKEGYDNWKQIQIMRERIADHPRPINNVKIYGSEQKIHKDALHAQQSFWRAIFGGAATARFHRPPHGLGFSELPQKHIRAMHDVVERFGDWFAGEPHNELIGDPADNSAYCFANPGSAIAVAFFTRDPKAVNTSGFREGYTLWWYDIINNTWNELQRYKPQSECLLHPVCDQFCAAVLTAA